jgi:hypothetical protein
MSEITVSVVGSTTINPTVGNGDTVNVTIASTGERGPTGATGSAGPANSLTIGTVSQGTAAATITGTSPNQVLNLVLQKGDSGTPASNIELQASATHLQWRLVGASTWSNLVALSAITGPTGSTGAAGTAVELQSSGTHIQWRYVGGPTWTNVVALSDLVGATGATGSKGDTGSAGPAGPANTLSIGTVTSGTAAATITGTAPNQTLNLVLQKGDTGATGPVGPAGPANTLTVGTVNSGSSPSVTITGTAPNQTLNVVLARGDTGATGAAGATGPANTLAIGSVTEGSSAGASITGTAPNQTLNLTIPATKLSIGTVTSGSTAAVTITGTAPAQTLNFTLPKGDTGSTGAQGPAGGAANIVEAATAAGFPATGASNAIFIATDVGRVFRFDASGVYVEIGTGGGASTGGGTSTGSVASLTFNSTEGGGSYTYNASGNPQITLTHPSGGASQVVYFTTSRTGTLTITPAEGYSPSVGVRATSPFLYSSTQELNGLYRAELGNLSGPVSITNAPAQQYRVIVYSETAGTVTIGFA